MTSPPPPQEPWGQPGPPPPPGYHGGYGGYAPEHPKGTTVLVLGILSLVVCGVLGPFAWAMGNRTLEEIDAAGGVAPNRGQVVAGRILGIVASAMLAIPLLIAAGVLVVVGIGLLVAS